MNQGTAVISPCEKYRYELRRWWNDYPDWMVFIGLNPSTADARIDDPTIRRCMSFAKLWGYGGMVMLNLFALRATNPRELCQADDPVGPDNDRWLTKHIHTSELVVAAWGNHGTLNERCGQVVTMFPQLTCLGLTKANQPKHPLYLPKTAEPTVEVVT